MLNYSLNLIIIFSAIPLFLTFSSVDLALFSVTSAAMFVAKWHTLQTIVKKFLAIGLSVGATTSIINAAFSSDALPFFSFMSFIIPVFGFVYGDYIYNSSKANLVRIQQCFAIILSIYSVSLALSLITNDFRVRQYVTNFGGFGSDKSGLVAVADFYGFPYFATFGVNSFAGICLAFIFVAFFFTQIGRSKFIKRTLILNILIIGFFGALLQSRGFYLGVIVFLVVLTLKFRILWWVKFSILSISTPITIWLLLLSDRVAGTFSLSNNFSIEQLTTNRSSLWIEFFTQTNYLIGSAFSALNLSGSVGNSYHLYLMTAIAKGGLIFSLAFFILIIKSILVGKRAKNTKDVIVFAALCSFIVQSLVWDVFAVQIYGHIAWFCVSYCMLINSRRPIPSVRRI